MSPSQGKIRLAGHLIAGWAVLSWGISFGLLTLFWNILPVGSGDPLVLPVVGDIPFIGPPILSIFAGFVIIIMAAIKKLGWVLLEGILALLSGIVLMGVVIFILALGSVS